MIDGRYHTEMKYHGREIIVDAAYIDSETIEIIVMDKVASNIEYELATTKDPEEAERIFQEYRWKYSEQPHATLAKKYKDLKTALIEAIRTAEESDTPEDGGTCNFDAPAIRGDRWRESMVKQAAREAGTTAFKWKPYHNTYYVFGVPGGGQANRRSRKAEAITETLKSLGYDALEYSAMD